MYKIIQGREKEFCSLLAANEKEGWLREGNITSAQNGSVIIYSQLLQREENIEQPKEEQTQEVKNVKAGRSKKTA
jgi:hypothetical protein